MGGTGLPVQDNRVTLTGFVWFVQNIMGIDPKYLPPDAPVLAWCLQSALNVVNPAFGAAVGWGGGWFPFGSAGVMPPVYKSMVYNLAGNNLIHLAPDVPGVFYATDGENARNVGYFEYQRANFKINTFAFGVVQAADDQGTGETLLVPDAMKGLTIQDLQCAKTPWGREYLAMAQSVGTAWGIT